MSHNPLLLDGISLPSIPDPIALAYDEPVDRVDFHFHLTRRQFVQVLGVGLVIAVAHDQLFAQEEEGGRKGGRGRGGGGGFFGGGPVAYAARLHIGKDGGITVFTGKVEGGQGARAELTQAAAEELRVSVDRVNLVMADTALVPNDGITAGSGTTPRTVPAVRQGAAAARDLLVALAAKTWDVDASEVEVHDGKVVHPASNREKSYADLATADDAVTRLPANRSLQRYVDAGQRMESHGRADAAPEPPRFGYRRASISVRHHSARHAAQQNLAAAFVWPEFKTPEAEIGRCRRR